jgi:ribosome-associated protein
MRQRERLDGQAIFEQIALACREKKGEDIQAFDVCGLVDYMDVLVVVSARSERQNRAIADHVVATLRRRGVHPLSEAGVAGGTWICLDYVDVVVHFFTPETRLHYDLDLLWGDAPRLPLPEPRPAADAAGAPSRP